MFSTYIPSQPTDTYVYKRANFYGKGTTDFDYLNTLTKIPLYTKRNDCCGCTACYAICPVSAILMRPDEEGFLYPVVDSSICVRCYKCIGVCPIKRTDKEKIKDNEKGKEQKEE